jgi:Fe-S oxidoreductase
MFTKEVRLQAALEDKLPAYINTLLDNFFAVGNPYGKSALCEKLSAKIKAHAEKTDLLFFLGTDARYMACTEAIKAIEVLEKAGVAFTLLENETASGAQLDFLIGAAEETKAQMKEAALQMNAYKTVVFYDPADAKAAKQLYPTYDVALDANALTFTAFLASLVESGALAPKATGKTVVYHDPFQLSRDLEETEEARRVISAFATLDEMLLNRAETVWAGNILMAEYMPEVIKLVAARRIFNAKSIGAKTMVTASVSEYVALKSVAQSDVEILSIEELILL